MPQWYFVTIVHANRLMIGIPRDPVLRFGQNRTIVDKQTKRMGLMFLHISQIYTECCNIYEYFILIWGLIRICWKSTEIIKTELIGAMWDIDMDILARSLEK